MDNTFEAYYWIQNFSRSKEFGAQMIYKFKLLETLKKLHERDAERCKNTKTRQFGNIKELNLQIPRLENAK